MEQKNLEMSRERIEVITYEEDRLNYFTDLMKKAQKKYNRLFKKFKDAPYLSAESEILSDAGREAQFHGDVVEMLEKGYRKQIVALPCNVGDYVYFKGLEEPWKVSAIHFYAEGEPQISITSGTGKVTSTMTFVEFDSFAMLIGKAVRNELLRNRKGQSHYWCFKRYSKESETQE